MSRRNKISTATTRSRKSRDTKALVHSIRKLTRPTKQGASRDTLPKPTDRALQLVSQSLHLRAPKTLLRFLDTGYEPAATDSSGQLLVSISTTRPNTTVSLPDWSGFSSIFDSYKVFGMKIQYIPRYPFDESSTTECSPVCMYYDPDSDAAGSPPATSWAASLSYADKTVWNSKHNHTYEFNTFATYSVDSTSSEPILEGGWLDVASEPTNFGGSISLISFDVFPLPVSTTVGWIQVSYDIAFANKR